MKLITQVLSQLPLIQYVTLGLIAGIVAGASYPVPAFVSILILSACGLYTAYTADNSIIVITILCFFFGTMAYQYHDQRYTKAANSLTGFQPTLVGKVSTVERIKNKFTYRSTIQVANHYIWVLSKETPGFEPGDLVQINKLYLHSPLNKEMGPWMKKEGIIATAFAGKIKTTILKNASMLDILASLNRQKEHIFTRLQQKLPAYVGNLMGLIFFGNKQDIDPSELMELRTTYMHWGLSHYLARSGLHIVILFTLFNVLLLFFGLPIFIRKLLLLGFCLLYTALSWMSISYIRALLLIFFYTIAQLANIKLSLLFFINLTCCIILLYNPYQLFALDFQLSFALTYILILIGHLKVQEGR
ncbi:hypothetical protein A3F06_02150 [candidate division TM6 bacterium RIFCSPHIGHO2_12_FULL_36_22]|nr:MAG: hypothetical protein A3F06_02150 [candidate division TM6 bacterium RIFCSPHIGHO2_12_FULL_36_22]